MDNSNLLNDIEVKSESNNSIFPKPLLDKYSRKFDKTGYKNRILEDDLMKDVKSLIDYGNVVFNHTNKITDLTNFESIKEETSGHIIANGFHSINEIAEDFYRTIKPHNGFNSLRRGFYKLLPIPVKVPVINLNTWKTQVLFNAGPNNNITYKYDCHVGPLVNKYAICRNLTTRKYLKLPTLDDYQKDFLQKMQSRIIYVSGAEMIKEKTAKYPMKEALWFVW